MGAIELTPDKAARAPFAAPTGTVGEIARDFSIGQGLVMRHVRDTLIIAPPLVITEAEVDILAERAWVVLDQTAAHLAKHGIS